MAETSERVALYRIFDAPGGQLLYVGISSDLERRWAEHSEERRWFPKVSRATVTWFLGRAEAADAEARAIKTERPEGNAKLNPSATKPPFPSPDRMLGRSTGESAALRAVLEHLISDLPTCVFGAEEGL